MTTTNTTNTSTTLDSEAVEAALDSFDFDENEGSAYVRDGSLYARHCDGATALFLGAVEDEDDARQVIYWYFQ